jgi:hypothetical protein
MSWQDGPYGPAAEARQEAYAAKVASGEMSMASLREKIEAMKARPKA